MTFIVNGALTVGSIASTPVALDLGQSVTFYAVGVSGGDGAYGYTWSGLPGGCPAVNASSVTCAPSQTGSFTPNLNVSDSAGARARASSHFVVSSDPSVAAIDGSRGSADVGQRVNYSAAGVSGGSGGYSFVWADLPTGCTSQNSSQISCTPTTMGSYSLTVTVRDSNDGTAPARLTYTVDPLPTVATPSASSASGVIGESLELSAKATLGSGDLRYEWSGLPQGCVSPNSSTLTCTPTVQGTYRVVVTVEDSNGGAATSGSLTLLVHPPAGDLTPTDEYALVGVAVAILAAMAIFVVWAVRRRQKAPPTRPH